MKTCPPLKDRHFHTFHRSSDLKLLVPLDVRNEKLHITLTDASNNLHYSQVHFNLKMNQRSLFHDHFDRRRQFLRCTDFFFFLQRNEFQAAVETTHLLNFWATISSNLSEYFSSSTSCISTSSGMDDTENSEFLLQE